MRWARAVTATFICCICTFGCATSPSQSAAQWANAHGGSLPIRSSAQARITSVSQPLIAACKGHTITVNVLATDAVTAYSLRDGHIFVTRGLMHHLSDAELQAA